MEYFLNKPIYQNILKLLEEKADAIVLSASGSIAHFEDGAEADAVSVVAHIEPVQEGSGDPSPDNVRPITGHTGMDVVVSPTTDAQDGTTYPITFPTEAGTVYGGYMDVTNGKLVVDRVEKKFDGTENWRTAANYCYLYGNLPSSINGGNTQISSHYETGFSYNENTIFAQTNGSIVKGARNDISAWKSELAKQYAQGTPVQICYELAEPITYDITPQQIALLLGVNNVWNNCNGNTNVTYRADMKLYIDNRG